MMMMFGSTLVMFVDPPSVATTKTALRYRECLKYFWSTNRNDILFKSEASLDLNRDSIQQYDAEQ
eukprot:scaffold9857_cov195-Amphora_coffeaeformis.AAC.5